MLDPAIPLVENPGTVRHSGSTAPMKGSQRRSASHVADRRCVDPDAAEALAGTNVIEAADLTQNAVNDVVEGEHRRRHQRRGDGAPGRHHHRRPEREWWAAAPRWSGR